MHLPATPPRAASKGRVIGKLDAALKKCGRTRRRAAEHTRLKDQKRQRARRAAARRGQGQNAWATCRRRYPNTLIDVKVFNSGKFRCVVTSTARQQPQRFRPQPRPQPQAQPQHRTADSAAVIGGIFGAIGQINRARNRNRPVLRQQPRRTTTSPARRRTTTPPRRTTTQPRCRNGTFNRGRCRGGLGALGGAGVRQKSPRLRELLRQRRQGLQ